MKSFLYFFFLCFPHISYSFCGFEEIKRVDKEDAAFRLIASNVHLLASDKGKREFITYLQEHLKEKALILQPETISEISSWYSHYIEIPEVDPYYPALLSAIKKRSSTSTQENPFQNEDSLVLSGSDSIEVGLLRTKKMASMGEVNIVFPGNFLLSSLLERFFERVEFKVGATDHSISVMGEGSDNIRNLMASHALRMFIPNKQVGLNVPFKHGHLAQVFANGTGRLYFRTDQDVLNYKAKKLTLPTTDHPDARTWHLKHTLVPENLIYSLIVLVRLKSQDAEWDYDRASKEILHLWAEHLRKNAKEDYEWVEKQLMKRSEAQGGTLSALKEALKILHLEI